MFVVNWNNSPKTYFISFGAGLPNILNALARIIAQAKSLLLFDKIYGFTDKDLREDTVFWKKHGEFIMKNKRGFGYWLWKPYLIKKVWDEMNEGDILMYCDSGNEIDIHKRNLIKHLFDVVKNDHLLGSYPAEHMKKRIPYLNEIKWTKNDLLKYMNMDKNENVLYTNQRQANTLLFYKCDKTTKLVEEWYNIASTNYHFIDDTPSVSNNDKSFEQHRHDQSIFSLLTKKYDLFSNITLEDYIEIIRNRTGKTLLKAY